MKKFVMSSAVAAAILFAPSVADASIGDQNLKSGMKDSDVSELQQWLNDKGYEAGPVDGIFGPLTKQGVEAFQAAQSISVDGIAGPQTFGEMNLGDSTTPQSSSDSSEDTAVAAESTYSSSGFALPASGHVTSEYGQRGSGSHNGIDIGYGGSSSISASASGTVTYAGTMNGYGNTIILEHTVDGQTYNTLYAHLRSISVSNGEAVSQGEGIGIMGNTGRSTGRHLHFEVHEGAWNGAKSNAVNPRSYVSF